MFADIGKARITEVDIPQVVQKPLGYTEPYAYSPRVPPELSDRIIDHLHADAPALKACSLTCRAWLATTRYHLFYSLALLKRRDFIRFDRCLIARTPWPTFPDPALYFRELEIVFVRGTPINASSDDFDVHYDERLKSALLAALARLKKVESLVLVRLDFPALPPDVRRALTTFAPALRSLALRESLIGGPSARQQLLYAFPRLRALDIHESTSVVPLALNLRTLNPAEPVMATFGPVSLHPYTRAPWATEYSGGDGGGTIEHLSLDCSSATAATVVCRLCDAPVRGVRGLYWHVSPAGADDAAPGSSLLQQMEPQGGGSGQKKLMGMLTLLRNVLRGSETSLEHLWVSFSGFRFRFFDEPLSTLNFGLSQRTQLISLCLGHIGETDCHWMLPLLTQLNSVHLRHLTFIFPVKCSPPMFIELQALWGQNFWPAVVNAIPQPHLNVNINPAGVHAPGGMPGYLRCIADNIKGLLEWEKLDAMLARLGQILPEIQITVKACFLSPTPDFEWESAEACAVALIATLLERTKGSGIALILTALMQGSALF